jgi:hypothetical protein
VTSLNVSVKSRRNVDVVTLLLSDIKRSTNRTPADLSTILRSVRATFLQQAFVDLNIAPSPIPVNVARDLGNPLLLSGPNWHDIIQQTPLQAYSGADTIRLYCCWDFDDKGAVGGDVGA